MKIENTIHDYFDGATNGNMEAIDRAFDSACKIYYIDEKGSLRFRDQAEFKRIILDNYQKFKRINKLISSDISGNIANAKVRADYPSFYFIDYLLLAKTSAGWKIVSKSTTTFQK